jgi:hypothetical protein
MRLTIELHTNKLTEETCDCALSSFLMYDSVTLSEAGGSYFTLIICRRSWWGGRRRRRSCRLALAFRRGAMRRCRLRRRSLFSVAQSSYPPDVLIESLGSTVIAFGELFLRIGSVVLILSLWVLVKLHVYVFAAAEP